MKIDTMKSTLDKALKEWDAILVRIARRYAGYDPYNSADLYTREISIRT